MGNASSATTFQPIQDPQEVLAHTRRFVVQIFCGTESIGVGAWVKWDTSGVISAYHILPQGYDGKDFSCVFDDGFVVELRVYSAVSIQDFVVFTPIGEVERPGLDVDPFSVQVGQPFVIVGPVSHLVGSLSTQLTENYTVGLGSGATWGDSGAPVVSMRNSKMIGFVSCGQLNDARVEGPWVRTAPLAWMKPLFVVHLSLVAEASQKPTMQKLETSLTSSMPKTTGEVPFAGSARRAPVPTGPRARPTPVQPDRSTDRSYQSVRAFGLSNGRGETAIVPAKTVPEAIVPAKKAKTVCGYDTDDSGETVDLQSSTD